MPESYWSSIKIVHIYPQLFDLTGPSFKRFFAVQPLLRPEHLKITIRYTDWWNWESNEPLDLNARTWHNLTILDSVKTVTFNLDVADVRSNELTQYINTMMLNSNRWKLQRSDGKVLKLISSPGAVLTSNWIGPTKFESNRTFHHHPDTEEMKYTVMVLKWILDENRDEGAVGHQH
jgi:hypothetical protein